MSTRIAGMWMFFWWEARFPQTKPQHLVSSLHMVWTPCIQYYRDMVSKNTYSVFVHYMTTAVGALIAEEKYDSESDKCSTTVSHEASLKHRASLRLCGPADEQLRRTELGASPAAKLRECNPFLYSAELTPTELPPKGSREEETHGVERDCTPGAELPDCRRATPAGAARVVPPSFGASSAPGVHRPSCRTAAGRLTPRAHCTVSQRTWGGVAD
ncbi:unnamed protein product [Boreogadus saida]